MKKTMTKTKQLIGVLALLGSSASMAATVTMTSTNLTPDVGNLFTVTMTATNFANVGGATMSIAWDATKASFTHANNTACAACLAPAGPVGTGTGTFIQVHLPTFDLLPGAPPVNGNFVIGQFTFQALAYGAMNLVINDDGGVLTGWFDNDTAEPIATNYQQANIVITAPAVVPVPAAAWLLVSALGSMAVLKRRPL